MPQTIPQPYFSIIIPVYKNEACLPDLMSALTQLNEQTTKTLEVVFVIDGSPDRCYEILNQQLSDMPFESQLILHSRNFGAFSAVRTGLQNAKGKFFSILAADLQEPPEVALEMLESLDRDLNSDDAVGNGDDSFDVIIATRNSRQDPWLSQKSAECFWWFYRRFIIPEIPDGGVGMLACNEHFRDELLKLEESRSSMIGLVFWLGFRRKEITYDRVERQHGSSAWTLSKKINYFADSILSFSDLPIKFLIALGVLGLLFSTVLGVGIFIGQMLGIGSVPGYAATMLTIMFFGCLNLVGMGVIGGYIWRVFSNTQNRPSAVVMKSKSFTSK